MRRGSPPGPGDSQVLFKNSIMSARKQDMQSTNPSAHTIIVIVLVGAIITLVSGTILSFFVILVFVTVSMNLPSIPPHGIWNERIPYCLPAESDLSATVLTGFEAHQVAGRLTPAGLAEVSPNFIILFQGALQGFKVILRYCGSFVWNLGWVEEGEEAVYSLSLCNWAGACLPSSASFGLLFQCLPIQCLA